MSVQQRLDPEAGDARCLTSRGPGALLRCLIGKGPCGGGADAGFRGGLAFGGGQGEQLVAPRLDLALHGGGVERGVDGAQPTLRPKLRLSGCRFSCLTWDYG